MKEIYTDIKSYDKNVTNLKNQFDDLKNRKEDVDDYVKIGSRNLETVTAVTGDWLKNAGELLRDEKLLQLLDEAYREQRDQGCFGFLPCSLYGRYMMSVLAKTKADDIQQKIQACPPGPHTKRQRAGDLNAIPAEFLEGLKSREKLLNEVWEKLTDDEVDTVGIYGMGGLGKTTLAKEIANTRAKGYFDVVVMVEISESPNIERIQDQIAEQIDLTLHDIRSTNERAKKIYNRMGDKAKEKILVIIDNIWEELDFEKVGIPRPQGKPNYKTLLTSRSIHVFRVMNVKDENMLQVKELTEDESWQLFQERHSPGAGAELESKKSEGLELLKKCGGLPLTIVALANMLRDQDLSVWRYYISEMEKPISSQIDGVNRETYSILETSYKLIPSKQKRMFFLLACLFPLGSNIPIEELMRYGIGLGLFQHVNSLIEAEKGANRWVQEFISSSLLLEVDDSKEHVKIHDIVRASAIHIARTVEQDKQEIMVGAIPEWTWEETCKEYTAISMMSDHNHGRLSGIDCGKLQILILKGSLPYELDDDFFKGMENLKVLVMSHMKFRPRLPSSMAELKKLRALHLEYCDVGHISLIEELENLIVLSLRESKVEILPYGIRKLQKLRLLDLTGCTRLKEIQADIIGSLSQLEGLYMQSYKSWNSILPTDGVPSKTVTIAEVMSLPRLKVLEMHTCDVRQLPTGDQFSQDLAKFKIRIADSKVYYDDYRSWEKYSSKFLSLRFDSGYRYGTPCKYNLEFSFMNVLLRKADTLLLKGIDSVKNLALDLDEEGFKDLKKLSISECSQIDCLISTNTSTNTMKRKRSVFYSTTNFPKLETLHLDKLRELKTFCDGEVPPGMFSMLKELCLSNLKVFQSHGLPVDFARNLTKLEVVECDNMEFLLIENASTQSDGEGTQVKREAAGDIVLRCLQTVNLRSLTKLKSLLCEAKCQPYLFNIKLKCPSLRKLNIYDIPSITHIWDHLPPSKGFNNLKEIEIKECAMKSLGSPSIVAALVQLEILSISVCPEMTEVVTASEAEDHQCCDITFPKLQYFHLFNLNRLKRLCAESYKLHFPALKNLILCKIPDTAIIFPSVDPSVKDRVPELTHLTLSSTKALGTLPVMFQKLSRLYLSSLEDRYIFSASGSWRESPLLKLEELKLVRLYSLEGLFENNDEDHYDHPESSICAEVTRLWMNDLRSLINPIPFHLFKGLRYLTLLRVINLSHLFSADSIAKGKSGYEFLPQLEQIYLKGCSCMDSVIASSEEAEAPAAAAERTEITKDEAESEHHGSSGLDIVFPRLKRLTLSNLSITSFSSISRPNDILHFPSLESVHITKCRKMEVFSPGAVLAPKLRTIKLLDCINMKWFSAGYHDVLHLPSLLILEVSSCDVMKSISSGSLKVPKLQEIHINDQPMKKKTDFLDILQGVEIQRESIYERYRAVLDRI